ncbi:MAG: hypothetical protein LAO31_07255 [Acidobacteriia bacterium]|nr:hypothetical protein [Terriglobia bacterium]
MRIKMILVLALLGLLVISTSMFGQTFWTHKDLVFGQVAAGGGYETVLNVTNRGSAAYTGTMYLFTGNGDAWTPFVNGVLANGTMNVSIPPGVTQSFHITVNGGVQAGTVFIFTGSTANNNFLEGNLTYFIRSGSTITDSVGVPPSNELYLSTVAFEDFSTIALALNNGDATQSHIAHLTLRLFNESNANVATKTLDLCGHACHMAQFLSEIFSGTSLGRGRLEISTADYPVYGTALTFVNNQFSSLPLGGSPRAYTFTTNTPAFGITTTGDASLWVDGIYVRGYVRFTSLNGSSLTTPETYFLGGRLIGTALRVSFYADGGNQVFGGPAANAYIRIPNFTFGANSLNDANNIFVVTWVDPAFPSGTFAYGTTRTGTMTMTRTN